MLLTKNKKVVLIYPDKITLEFLASLKVRRKMLNFTLRECSKKLGIVISNLNYYERGLSYPCLKNLIKLAEFYGADISGSINWKIYHGKINLKNLRQQKERYDFSFSDISEECELSKNTLFRALSGKPEGSIRGLGRLIDVIESEKERERFRNELLQSK